MEEDFIKLESGMGERSSGQKYLGELILRRSIMPYLGCSTNSELVWYILNLVSTAINTFWGPIGHYFDKVKKKSKKKIQE